MLLLVLAGATGIGLSFALLRAGITDMWVRYPVAGAASYVAFLVMLGAWARRQVDNPELVATLERAMDIGVPPAGTERQSDCDSSTPPAWLDFVDFPFLDDLGEFVLVVAVVAVIVGLVLVVVLAPVILSEALLDSLLVAGLWHRFSRYNATRSARGAVRATVLPAALVILSLAVVGLVLQILVPGVHSIGDVFGPRPG